MRGKYKASDGKIMTDTVRFVNNAGEYVQEVTGQDPKGKKWTMTRYFTRKDIQQ